MTTTDALAERDALRLRVEKLEALVKEILGSGVEYTTRTYRVIQVDHQVIDDLRAALNGES